MLSDGIRHIGDGLLEVTQERLQGLLVPDDINDIYDVEPSPFARGKFAAVRRAIHKKSGVSFAAKFLRRRRRAQCWAKDIGHEIAVLMLCSDSKHIVKLHGVHETKTETALLLEMATGGELQAILDEEGELSEAHTRICMREILKALQYLHKKCIAHLDLKPQNILLCGDKVEDGLKLCDFGISRVVEEGGKIREILGTPDYVSPEVLQYEPLSLQTDIWSIGVLAYVLLTGCSPFGGDSKQETFLNISKCTLTFPPELFEDVSPVAIDFIKSALRIKPHERMNASQCLEHRWLQEESPMRPLVTIQSIDVNNKQHPQIESSTTTNGTTNGDLCCSDEQNQHHHNHHQQNHNHKIDDNPDDHNTNENVDDDDDKENILVTKSSSKMIQLTSPSQLLVAALTTSAENNECRTNNRINSDHSDACEKIIIISHQQQNHQTLIATTTSSTPSPPTSISTASITLFPDAPTTPKVCRKAPPDSPPSVKALVKKFQLDSQAQQQQSDLGELSSAKEHLLDGGNSVNGVTGGSNGSIEDCSSRCTIITCLACGGLSGCRHLNSARKSMGLDQRITC